jgi:hypothetical protein
MTMFTKTTIALAVLVGVTSSAFAATKHKPTNFSDGAFAATSSRAPMGWRNPSYMGAYSHPNSQGELCQCE